MSHRSDSEEKHRPSTTNSGNKAIFQSGNGPTYIQDSTIVVGAASSATAYSATGDRPKQKLEKGFVQISDNIFMNTDKPVKEGMQVYEGYQEHVSGHRLLLAIKAIFPCTKKSIREVQHLLNLASHPNVVRIIQSVEQKGHLSTLYIAMELCGSKNLHDYLNENREKNVPLDFKKTMSYSKRLIRGIKHIHHNRIIHGDLKPENILFSLDGGQIKISDFGISKALRQSCSVTKKTSQGTEGYRAPETYNSDVISMKADIYSLGVTLYSLWTYGRHPFGKNPYQQVVNIINNSGRDLSGLPEEMGAKKDEFLDLLDKMLQVDPENRPTIEEISKHPFFSSSQATAQASLIRQLSFETSPEETPDLSHWRENSTEEATQRVSASVQTRPKQNPGHLHRMASSSDPRDDDPWTKKLRVTNIPRHLSSYKALRRHFERFGRIEECLMKDKSNFASITFHNHDDALSAKYEAISAGLDHNLVIKWEDIEGPAVNVADPYPSSKLSNVIVDGINAGRKNSVRSETLRKMKNLGMDVDKLNVWRVTTKSDRVSTSVIPNMDRGCRIGSRERFIETRSEKVKINGEERLISELDIIEVPFGLTFSLISGIACKFGHKFGIVV